MKNIIRNSLTGDNTISNKMKFMLQTASKLLVYNGMLYFPLFKAFIRDQAFIHHSTQSYCLPQLMSTPVHMATQCASEFHQKASVVKGHDIYKFIWTPEVNEELPVIVTRGNSDHGVVRTIGHVVYYCTQWSELPRACRRTKEARKRFLHIY